MRFRSEQHLRRPADIRAARERGRRIDCGIFSLWCQVRTDDPAGPARACFVASGAAVGHAVLRNRAKRRLREVFRRNQDRLPGGCDLLVVARAAATRRPFSELEQAFMQGCQRATGANRR